MDKHFLDWPKESQSGKRKQKAVYKLKHVISGTDNLTARRGERSASPDRSDRIYWSVYIKDKSSMDKNACYSITTSAVLSMPLTCAHCNEVGENKTEEDNLHGISDYTFFKTVQTN